MDLSKKRLLFDAGNSFLKVFKYSQYEFIEKININWNDFSDEIIENLFSDHFDDFVLISVVADKKDLIKNIFNKNNLKLDIVGETIFPDIKNNTEFPEKVGLDRLVGSYAAWKKCSKTSIVIDLGTALTIDLIDDNGIFHGGIISAGFDTLNKAIGLMAPRLANNDLSRPVSFPGRNTKEAINAGIYFMIAGCIEKSVQTYQKKYPDAKIYGTGGGFKEISGFLNCDFEYIENLIADGLLLILDNK